MPYTAWNPTYPEFARRPAGSMIGDSDWDVEETGDQFKIKNVSGEMLTFPWVIAPESSAVHSFGYESCRPESSHFNKLVWFANRSVLTVRFKPSPGKKRTRYAYFYEDDATGQRHFEAMKSMSDPADAVKELLIKERVSYERSA